LRYGREDIRPNMFALSDAPAELILLLADACETAQQLGSLAGACRRFHAIVNPRLYQFNVRHQRSNAAVFGVAHGRLDILERLLEHGADAAGLVNKEWRVPDDLPVLASSAEVRRERFTTGLTRRVVGLEPQPYFALLHVAARNGQDDAVRWLLRHGADVDAPSEFFCLCHLLHFDRDGEHLTDPLPPRWAPLHFALCHRRESTAHLLLDHRAPGLVSRRTRHPTSNSMRLKIIHQAAGYGMRSVVERAQFLEDDFDVDAVEQHGDAAIHYATYFGHAAAIIPVLAAMGARLDLVGSEHKTAMDQAVEARDIVAALTLLKAGAAVDVAEPCALPPMVTVTNHVCDERHHRESNRALLMSAALKEGEIPAGYDAESWEGCRRQFLELLASSPQDVPHRPGTDAADEEEAGSSASDDDWVSCAGGAENERQADWETRSL
jgi:ankyrin repeat protein